jgi:hypothetical protein
MTRKVERQNPSKKEVENFIKATGGGKGCYVTDREIEFFNQTAQCERPDGFHENQGLGFGRIKFKQDPDPKPYIRVPWNSRDGAKTENGVPPDRAPGPKRPEAAALTSETAALDRVDVRRAHASASDPQDPAASNSTVSTDFRLLLNFVETVWGLQRPNLLVSITGGATDSLENSDDLQLVLSDLVSFARRTSAWLTTGGTHAGIMKLVGENVFAYFLFCILQKF